MSDEIKNKIYLEYDRHEYEKVIKLYESNSIVLHEDYFLIGIIMFCYQEIGNYDAALKIIKNHLNITNIESQDIEIFELIFIVGVNCYIEVNKKIDAYNFAKQYIKYGGKSGSIKQSYEVLKNEIVSRNSNIFFWSFSICFIIFIIVERLSAFLEMRFMTKEISFSITLLFAISIAVMYFTDILKRIFEYINK